MHAIKYIIFFMLIALPARAEERFLNIQEVTSKNGLTAWLVEDHSLPIIAMQFSFKGAGSINDTAEKQGRARLLSNMLDEGAGELSSQEFQKQLSDHSISLGFSSGRDNFGGHLKTLTRYKEKAFNLLTLALTKPLFDEEPLDRMKKANISRVRSSLTNPDWIGARIQNDLVYNDHPYALNSGGTITSLGNLTTDDLKEFKTSYLTTDRLVIGVMGDITPEELKVQLDNVFSGLPKKGKETISNVVIEHKTGIYLHEKDIPQTVINVALPAFDKKDPDYFAAKVFNYIFGGGGFGSRLMEQAREKEGLTYGIYSSTAFLNDAQKLYISTSTQNDKTQRMLDIIDQEIERINKHVVNDEEIQNAKAYLTGSLPLSLTSTNKISSLLTSLQQNERSITYLDEYKNRINAITKNDILRVAKRILTPENMNIVLVGQPNISDNNVTRIKELPNVE